MDNLTHSLIGLVAGESIARSRLACAAGLPFEVRRDCYVALGVIGGNLPDLDLLYSYAVNPGGKLGYLLQHRGYTHTLVGCAILSLLLYLGAELWLRVRAIAAVPRDRLAIAGVAVIGTFLHLAMDALNSYGVHPFWPLQNRWYYGDSVFIVEPLYWATAAPLLFVVTTTALRVVIAGALAGGAVLSLVSDRVAPAVWGGCVVLTLLLLLIGARTSARTAAWVSAFLMLSVTVVFIASGAVAAHRVERIAGAVFASEQLVDHVLTPMPMNPVCWDLLLLTTRDDRYAIRHGVLATAPWSTAASCPPAAAGRRTTAPQGDVPAPDTAEIHWVGEFAMSRRLLAAVVAGHCQARLLMQFARAPFATRAGGQWIIGDFRFDREPQLGMAEIGLNSMLATGCTGRLPWIAPRGPLLEPAPDPVRAPLPVWPAH